MEIGLKGYFLLNDFHAWDEYKFKRIITKTGNADPFLGVKRRRYL